LAHAVLIVATEVSHESEPIKGMALQIMALSYRGSWLNPGGKIPYGEGTRNRNGRDGKPAQPASQPGRLSGWTVQTSLTPAARRAPHGFRAHLPAGPGPTPSAGRWLHGGLGSSWRSPGGFHRPPTRIPRRSRALSYTTVTPACVQLASSCNQHTDNCRVAALDNLI